MATSQQHTAQVGDLLSGIGRDLKTIAVDELELSRDKLEHYVERAIANASVALFGMVVALVGFGMLCTVVVIALAPVIPALWLRLLLMSIVYMGLGAGATVIFAKRVAAKDLDLHKQVAEVGETIDAVAKGLSS